ncbi:MAG: chromate efflux transporter [Cellvibrionaceae bacterium]|nr:chromate efflux transporter [Cellvibrionaceae bacterium]
MSNSKSPNTGSALEVFKVFLKLGLTSFGGPIAHIGYFRKELLERRRWLSESQFSQLLVICQFLPGPASSQLGFALGLQRAGWLGALAAFIAFTLPSALLMFVFAALLPQLGGDTAASLVQGLKLVAVAVVADAVWGMAKNLCPDLSRRLMAVAAAALILLFDAAEAQLLVVAGGALAGYLYCNAETGSQSVLNIDYSSRTGFILLGLFGALLILLPLLASDSLAAIFYQAGALVFGGGHVVLPLLEQGVVGQGLLDKDTFLAGYGAAQAIPGPMFSLAAYLGAAADNHSLVGATIALLFIFLPGFLLLAGVLPLWNRVLASVALQRALLGVGAAVLGLLGAALYQPVFSAAVNSPATMAIALVGFAMLRLLQWSPLAVLGFCVGASFLL